MPHRSFSVTILPFVCAQVFVHIGRRQAVLCSFTQLIKGTGSLSQPDNATQEIHFNEIVCTALLMNQQVRNLVSEGKVDKSQG